MSEAAAEKVLSRKAQAARRAIEARGMSAEKALRRAYARTAEEAWNLALIARNAQIQMVDQYRAVAVFEAGDMILLLDGPGEAIGFAVLDRATVTALVEVQTLGIVTDMELDDRRLTPTDAAVAAPLIEGALVRLCAYLGNDPLGTGLAAYRYGAMIESPRIAANLLSASRYRLFEAELDMGGGLRQGRVSLALPDEAAEPERIPEETVAPRHEELMMSLPAEIDAVLCRMRLPVSVAEALTVGALLPLPADVLDQAELVARGGYRVTRGRLGQLNGQRAIRISQSTGASRQGEARGRPEIDVSPPKTAPEEAAEGPMEFGIPALTGGSGMKLGDDEYELPDLPPLDFEAALGGDIGEGGDFPDFATAMGDLPDLSAFESEE
ncbi:hypothetical protein OCH239_05535 [Roseivivax halodurans JCM 10272]|uniref:Flagellar motor switch protein FliN-like C-terminal domain-containing protein n=1 Tax=Roseivivax halodurans JCM 10272 TaxID=1449350 RepID=X7EDD7_9RHOB|nr:flagellar motor switch protein FliM [Roseivivax halodurans]ETX14104.1 hypothetical protein OCH239_05535 [Roseivivax halodurans JCM 10272]